MRYGLLSVLLTLSLGSIAYADDSRDHALHHATNVAQATTATTTGAANCPMMGKGQRPMMQNGKMMMDQHGCPMMQGGMMQGGSIQGMHGGMMQGQGMMQAPPAQKQGTPPSTPPK